MLKANTLSGGKFECPASIKHDTNTHFTFLREDIDRKVVYSPRLVHGYLEREHHTINQNFESVPKRALDLNNF